MNSKSTEIHEPLESQVPIILPQLGSQDGDTTARLKEVGETPAKKRREAKSTTTVSLTFGSQSFQDLTSGHSILQGPHLHSLESSDGITSEISHENFDADSRVATKRSPAPGEARIPAYVEFLEEGCPPPHPQEADKTPEVPSNTHVTAPVIPHTPKVPLKGESRSGIERGLGALPSPASGPKRNLLRIAQQASELYLKVFPLALKHSEKQYFPESSVEGSYLTCSPSTPLNTDTVPAISAAQPPLGGGYIYVPLVSYSRHLQRDCRLDDFSPISGSWVRKGSFGTVFPVKDKHTGARFVIKRIGGEQVNADPAALVREELIHNALKDPHISEFYCTMVDESNGNVYFLLEYIDGVNLFDYVKEVVSKGQSMTDREISCVLAGLFLALEYLHKLGIAHRDLKPSNILLVKGFQPKLIDFGLSVHEDDRSLTKGMGTPLYLAPEAIEPSFAHNSRAFDLYSLGLVAYFMKTGLHYFGPSDGTFAQYMKDRRAAFHAPVKPTGSAELDDLLTKLLQTKALQRWNSFHSPPLSFMNFKIFERIDWGSGKESSLG